MSRTVSILQKALTLHQTGALHEAESLYRQVLKEEPHNPDALHLFGLARHQSGDNVGALVPLKDAVKFAPGTAMYRNSLGEVFRQLDDLVSAEREFVKAINLSADYAEAHNNLGNLYREKGDLTAAIDSLNTAVSLKPDYGDARNNLGVALFEHGETDAAIQEYRLAISLNPDQAKGHNNLGNALRQTGELKAAEDSIQKALALRPTYGEALSNLGAVYQKQRRLDDAIGCYRKALAIDPRSATAHNNLAAALFESGDIKAAVSTAEQAILLDPSLAEAYNTLGNALIQSGRNQAAVDAYEKSVTLNPDFETAYFNLISHLPVIADWTRLNTYLPQLRQRVESLLAASDDDACSAMIPASFTMPYFSTDHALHKKILTGVARYVASVAAAIDFPPAAPMVSRKQKISVGYVSPDFGDHPISHVTLPVYRLHDRTRFSVHAFSLMDRDDKDASYRRHIETSVDHFHDLAGLSFADAAQTIRDQDIDILVDLSGYMRFGRPQIFALRPAPIQVYWLGHGGGLGASYMDYVIGDPILSPPEHDDRYVEAVARLPDTFSSADQPAIAKNSISRRDHDLPEDAFVFCAFNNALKLEPDTVATWMDILSKVPNSVIWLSAGSDPALRRNLMEFASEKSVGSERLIFADRLPDKSHHLARHQLADLFLDSFKFNASTTALDALWGGLPLLTLQGSTFHSRIGASYLRAIGLDDLITTSAASFVEAAVELAQDQARLEAIKDRLLAARTTSPLFDAERFVSNLEAAYETMYEQRLNGQQPHGFNVPAPSD